MNNYRYVYYIQPGYLHILIEKILKHYKFEILNDEQKEKLHYNLIYNCSNKYYNYKIKYYKLINKDYCIDCILSIII